jgi:gluconokinase
MGVSGCGKSSVGRRLAQLLACKFIEGDELHPLPNVQKMSGGVPLTYEDRWPWLDLIRSKITHAVDERRSIVVCCSALRRDYRQHLRRDLEQRLAFVFLDGAPELLKARMAAREGHFMPPSLLATQLVTLENRRPKTVS